MYAFRWLRNWWIYNAEFDQILNGRRWYDHREKRSPAFRFGLNYEGVGMLVMSKVNSFKVRAQGVGHVDTKDLIAEVLMPNVEGIGSVKVYGEKLKANVQGIGSLTYCSNQKNI